MSVARPTLSVIAGPNGAGKSTFYLTYLKATLPGVEFVNDRAGGSGHPRPIEKDTRGRRKGHPRPIEKDT